MEAKNEIANSVRKIENAFTNLNIEIRRAGFTLFKDDVKSMNELHKKLSEVYTEFFNYAKKNGSWEEYVKEENEKTLKFLGSEFKQDCYGRWSNSYGDEYWTNPFTGLIEQIGWGL